MLSAKTLFTLLLGTTVFLGLLTLSILHNQMFIEKLMIIGFILACLAFIRAATPRK